MKRERIRSFFAAILDARMMGIDAGIFLSPLAIHRHLFNIADHF